MAKRLLFVLLLLIASVPGFSTEWIIGSGTTSNTTGGGTGNTYPTPFGNYSSNTALKAQFLYRGSELTAAGMTAGSISGLGFNVTDVNGCTALGNYTISIKSTTATALTTTFDAAGFTQVYTATSYQPVTGWNMFRFSAAFSWNGTDNLLVQICCNSATAGQNALVQMTTGLPANYAADRRGTGTATICTNTTANTAYTRRTNIKFVRPDACSGTPSAAAVSSPNEVCSGSGSVLSLNAAGDPMYTSGLTYQWQKSADNTNWTDIASATSSTYSATNITAATFFRNMLTCTASGQQAPSQPAHVAIVSATNSYPAPPTERCDIDGNISFVSLSNLSRPSGCEGSYSVNNCVGSARVRTGQSYNLSVTGTYVNNNITAWIDFNKNNQFESSEYTSLGSTGNNYPVTLTKSITIPATAGGGYTGMRVRLIYNDVPSSPTADPSNAFGYGETEDYLVKVITTPTATASSTNPCANSSFTVTGASDLPDTRYYWSGPNNFTATTTAFTKNNVTSSDAGTYTLFVVSGSDTTPSVTVSITVRPAPAKPTASSNFVPGNIFCTYDTLRLFGSALPAGFTGKWTGPALYSSTDQNPVIPKVKINRSGSFVYTITAPGGCFASDTTVVELTQGPDSVKARSPKTALCEGEQLTLSAYSSLRTDPSISYEWGGPNSFFATDSLATNASVVPDDSGTYIVYVRLNGCERQDSIRIRVNPKPADVMASNNSPVCAGTPVDLTGSSSTGGVTYSWRGPGGYSSTLQNPTLTNTTPTQSGNYTLIVRSGICTDSTVTEVIINEIPRNHTITVPATVCTADSLKLKTASTSTGVTYEWFGPNGYNSTEQNPAIENATFDNAGEYLSVATKGTCSDTARGSVVVNQSPENVSASNNGPVCSGGTLSLTGSSSTPGITYSWTGPSGFSTTDQNPSISNAQVANSGVYTLSVTLATCTKKQPTTATVNQTPQAVTSGVNGPICEGDSLKLTSSSSTAGVSYSWTGPNGFSSTERNPAIANATVAATGTYTVTVSMAACTVTSSVNATVNPSPAGVSATNNGPICSGNTLQLTGATTTANATFLWTGPNGFSASQQSPAITNATAAATGTYTFKVTAAGCSTTRTTAATVTQTPQNVTASANSPVCEQDTIRLISSSSTAGVSYSWTGPNGYTSAQQNPKLVATLSSGGTYTVVARLGSCTANASTSSVTVNPAPANSSATNNGPICNGSTLQLNGSTTTSGATYSWSGPNSFASTDQNPAIPNAQTNATGVYTLRITAAGCLATTSTSATVGQTPQSVTASASNTTYCAGDSVKLFGNSSTAGVSYSWTGPNGFTSSQQNPVIPNAATAVSGTYNLTVRLNTCSAQASVSIVVNPAPAGVQATNNGPICSGATLSFTGTSTATGATYSWSGPNGFASTSQNPSIPNATTAATGTYTLIVSAGGCSARTSTPAVVRQTPESITTGSNAPICSGDTLKLTAGSSTAGVSYAWAGPNGFTSSAQNPRIPNAPAAGSGNYTVTVSLGTCSATGSTSVTVNPSPAGLSASNNGPICSGGTLVLTGNSNTPGVSYSWSGPNGFLSNTQSPSIPNATTAATGTYVLTVSSGGCSATANTIAQVTQTPDGLAVSSNSPICQGDTLRLHASSSTAGVSYSWSGPNGYTSNMANPLIPNAGISHSGNYSVTVSLGSCSVTQTIAVSVTPTPQSASATSNSPVCTGGTLQLNASSPTPGLSYSWTGPNGFTSHVQNPAIANVTTAASGSYTVVASAGSCSVSANVAVTINQSPLSPNASSNSPVCSGDTIRLTSSSSSSGVTYSWTGPNSFTSSVANPKIPNADTPMSGTYVVTLRANGCSVTVNVPVTVNRTPGNVTATSNSPVCSGNPLQLSAGSNLNDATYSWSGPSGFSSALQNPSIPNAQPSATGAYTVQVSKNGCARSATANVIVNQAPTDLAATTNSPVCAGDTIKLRASSAFTGVTYAWSGPSGYASTVANPNIPNATSARAGTYTVSATLNGCRVQQTVAVTVNPLPTGVAATSNAPLCTGSTLQLNATTNNAGTTFSWTKAGGYSSTLQNPTIPNVGLSDSGAYILRVTLNGCSVTDSTRVRIVQTPQSVAASANTPLCAGDTLRLNGSSATAGVNFSWTGPNSFGSTSQNPRIANATTAASGRYVLTVTTGNFCSRTDTVQVQVNPNPTKPLGADTIICTPATITLDAANAGATYSWSTGSTAQSITVDTTGSYRVAITNGFGCTTRDTVVVTAVPVPVVRLGADTLVCSGQPLTLDAGNPGTRYVWSTGDTTRTIQVRNPGTYAVVASIGRCVGRDTISVQPGILPSFTLGRDTALCPGISLYYDVDGSGTSYHWNTGINTPDIVISTPGSYSVTVTSATGCRRSDTVQIRQGQFPVVTLSNDTLVCAGAGFRLDAGNPGSTYQWTTGEATRQIEPAVTGTYLVQVRNADGCAALDSAFVEVRNKPRADSFNWFKLNEAYYFSIVNPQEVFSQRWSFGDGSTDTSTNPAHTYTQDGVYEVKLTVGNECGSDSIARRIQVGTVSVAGTPSLKHEIRLFPNPAREQLHVSYSGKGSIRSLSLASPTGATVYQSGTLSGAEQSVPVQTLASGTYLLTVRTDDGVASFRVQIGGQ